MKLTQDNFDKLIETFNHKVTNIESDVKWIKNLGKYLAGILTLILVALIGVAI